MKSTLEFDLDSNDDKENLNRCLKSLDMLLALREVGETVFLPARKHGYIDDKLQKLSDRDVELIGILEEKFYSILTEYKIDTCNL